MSIITSNEMFINMKAVPSPDSDEYVDFALNEWKKVRDGVTIDGIYISGWLYWHINHWKISIDTPSGDRVSGTPYLRDNEWMIAEGLERAEREKKILCVFGARQSGKTSYSASYIARKGTILKNSQNIIIGSSKPDLANITNDMDFGLQNVTEFFKIPRITRSWSSSEVLLGVKSKEGDNIVHSTFRIRNTEEGRNTEVTAGSRASSALIDEAGKGPFAKVLEALRPALRGPFGWRAPILVTGCVCAGTKVWNNKGELVNIEDLDKKDGIIGFDISKGEISKEPITYWQPPADKECYRITTRKGHTLECSDDHPILKISKWTNRTYFVETKDLKKGDKIVLVNSVPIFGEQRMWEPRIIGMLIGDGSYGFDKTPVFSNCDAELNDYFNDRLECIVEKDYITKDGRVYRETRVKGICPELRKIGIYGQTKSNKRLPVDIDSYCKEDLSEMISGLFDTDGCISKRYRGGMIKLTAAHKEILEQVKYLLIKFDVHSIISYKKPNLNNLKDRNGWYDLQILDKRSILNFRNEFKLLVKNKVKNLDKICETLQARKTQRRKGLESFRLDSIRSVEKIGVKSVYNLTAGATNTYVANMIVTHNTGGAFDKGRDAEIMFFHPETNDVVEYVDEMTGSKTGMFMPGWVRQDFKKESNLAEYLGIESDPLKDIRMLVSDKEMAVKTLHNERKAVAGDPDSSKLLKRIMYDPLKVDEIFLTESDNFFPQDMILEQKSFLINNPPHKDNVELYVDADGKVKHKFTDKKPIMSYPHKADDNMEGVIEIWEYPMDNLPSGIYIAATDPYKFSQAKYSDSVGSTYIFKRTYDISSDKFQNMMVACYHGRPKKLQTWYDNTKMLLKFYNAKTLCENMDYGFIQHLIDKNEAAQTLVPTPKFLYDIHPNTTVGDKRSYGIHMTADIKNYLYTSILEYLSAVVRVEKTEDGESREIHGIRKVIDPLLLEEMLKFNSDANVDRIIAFGLVVAYSKSLDKIPLKTSKDNRYEEYFDRAKITKSPFRGASPSPFRTRIQ